MSCGGVRPPERLLKPSAVSCQSFSCRRRGVVSAPRLQSPLESGDRLVSHLLPRNRFLSTILGPCAAADPIGWTTRLGPTVKHITATDNPATGYLCIPLTAQSESLGILHVRFFSGAAHGREAEELETKQRLGVAIAENLALALANLKLRETLQNQAIRDPLPACTTGAIWRDFGARVAPCEASQGADRGGDDGPGPF